MLTVIKIPADPRVGVLTAKVLTRTQFDTQGQIFLKLAIFQLENGKINAFRVK